MPSFMLPYRANFTNLLVAILFGMMLPILLSSLIPFGSKFSQPLAAKSIPPYEALELI